MTLRDENDPIGMLGVVGAGFMGTGIAETAARAGVEVTVYEPEQAPLDRSRAQLSASTQTAVDRGKSSVADREALLERVRWTSDLDGLADAPLVIEAVVEDQDVKMDVFRRLDGVVRADALLASNTSSIPIAELASATTRPESVLGIHFFSPVPVMRLVEVVEALRTSASTMEAAHAMFEEGFASAEDIDAGMHLGCAHPMGPLQLCDFIGLDVMYAICRSLHDEFNRAEYAPPPLLKRMVASGMLGRKSGRGFYDYEEAA